ncbi:MAG: hypothetical protein KKD01_07445 [Proteobacteria bacterium]|nr:hypothetical protein [Pseudomonadota bacterium]MBU1233430.1 hypothetical protein [Pseudomonadota bacterium]MBU1420087.1 hypothetical protein [Pseudomonadota bacterium]MBU1454550.1 hypothetical protein [Pseudomonadota bacterium]
MNGKFLGNVGLSVVLLGLVTLAVVKVSASSGVQGLFLPEIKVSDSTEALLRSVTLARSAVKVQAENHQVDSSFAIENKGGDDIKNVTILCTLYDSHNKEQGRDKWVVYDTVKSQGYGDFTFSDKRFISDSVVRSDCQIVDLQVVKAPLITVHRSSAGEGGGHDQQGAAGHGAEQSAQH